jgi:hypothetical protein
MKTILNVLLIVICVTAANAQDNVSGSQVNAAQKMLEQDNKLTIGGYAQIDYNQPFGGGTRYNGKLDVHRLVLLFGYKFSERVQFVSEIELEHVEEVYVEQAFVNYFVNEYLNVRAGLMLIPMGIINEYHEPPTYNGVERPNLDYYVVPTTWREIGLGITGVARDANIKYQAYIFNGFLSYDGEGRLNGKYGLRKGRQKGISSVFGTPNYVAKVEYYGIRGLNAGISGYFGKSQSTLTNGVEKNNTEMMSTADSSIITISMAGLDVRYNVKGLSLRGQFNYGSFVNTKEYNEFTGSDMGESMVGFYAEAAFDIFSLIDGLRSNLTPFVRYENYDTQHTVSGDLNKDPLYHREEIVTGIGWKPAQGVAFKADIQFIRPKSESTFSKTFNMGVGVWF